MSRFSASPIVAAFACARLPMGRPAEEDDDIIGIAVQKMAEELRAHAADADTQDIEQAGNLGVEDGLPQQKGSSSKLLPLVVERRQ